MLYKVRIRDEEKRLLRTCYERERRLFSFVIHEIRKQHRDENKMREKQREREKE